MPQANLALISVPGQFAKREALNALVHGLNVFLFSSNVSRDDELELKETAARTGLLVMGPDCGTSIINHKVLGFGNVVRPGPIGLVSASGTGLQQVSILIQRAGLGISQAIGTGGGDLSEKVGGITMIQGIRMLEADEETKVIALISKPPSPEVAEKVLQVARGCKKPVVVNFLGGGTDPKKLGRLRATRTLDDAANITCALAGSKGPAVPSDRKHLASIARREYERLTRSQRFIRGLFAGGTLCYEAQVVLAPVFKEVYSNAPIRPERLISGNSRLAKHVCLDLGAEEFVEGRAHPMIDFTLRNQRISQEARDPMVAVILFDVELGYGSNPDPAGHLLPAIESARAAAKRTGRYLPFVASVLGTEGDSQGLEVQQRRLEDAGVLVAASNAQAARLAALIASRGVAEAQLFGGVK